MVFKDGVAFLQAGGGIVFDSVEEDEYVETVNKLGANVRCLEEAEGEPPFSPFIRVLLANSVYRSLLRRPPSRAATGIE